jgi:hypothetical protein
MVLIYHISSYLASSHSGEEVLFMAFSTRVYEHPQFELLHLLSELYNGSSLTLSIDFLIHNIILPQIIIGLFIEASI